MSGLPAYILSDKSIEINRGRRKARMAVRNCGDRPIQVGSHFHFFEVNPQLGFDREQAFGMRLDIPAGTAVRFEPGDEKEIELVEFGGQRRIFGFNGLVEGPVDGVSMLSKALDKARERGFQGTADKEGE